MPRRSLAGYHTDKTWPIRANSGHRRRDSRSACAWHARSRLFPPLHVDGAPPVGEARVASDDEKRLEMRQRRDDVIYHSVREIFLFRIGAQVGEGEDDDRG